MKKFIYLILIQAFLLAPAHSDDSEKNRLFLAEVVSDIQKKCQTGTTFAECRADQTPKKCKSLVYGDPSGWARCVYSCGSASFFSKSIGECSK